MADQPTDTDDTPEHADRSEQCNKQSEQIKNGLKAEIAALQKQYAMPTVDAALTAALSKWLNQGKIPRGYFEPVKTDLKDIEGRLANVGRAVYQQCMAAPLPR